MAKIKAMRLRLRHIHIPDLPPLYAPRFLAPRIRDFIQSQIKQMRDLSEESDAPENLDATGGSQEVTPRGPFARPPSTFDSWVKRASPPPTVLSFTRRPTYILPKHRLEKTESWQADFLTNALKSKLMVKFPEPPRWSSLPWRPFWEHKQPEDEWQFDPISHEWPKAGVMIMPCAEAMYLGPGQVSMWPIIDLRDDVQRGKRKFRTKYEYERVLEDTTIEVLKREYGIDAFAIPGSTGVWVESKIPPPEMEAGPFERGDGPRAGSRRDNVRRIATIHTSITNDITQWGVSIHVGQPDPIVDSWTSFTNPWTPIRQHKTTTSIAAELAYIGNSPRHESRKSQLELYGQRKTRYLQTYFNTESAFAGSLYKSMPYSLVKTQGGRREPAPLGLDNRDLSSAWTYEFARQLGMHDGFVDHYGVVDFSEANSTDMPSKTPKPGFMTRPLLDEHWLTKPYEQVDVPLVQSGKSELVSSEIMEDTLRLEKTEGKLDSGDHGGWMTSWPLWCETLKMKLEQSIAGGPWDTRLRSHEWEKEQAARQMRRKTALRETEELKQQWAAEPRQLIRRPLTDQMIKKLSEMARDMEQALQEVPVEGRLSQELLESTAQMRRLLENRFAGRVKDMIEPKKPRKAELSAVLEEDKAEARQAHDVQHDAQSLTALLSSTSLTSTPAQGGAPTRNLKQSRQDIAWRRLPNTRVGRPAKDGRNNITPVDKPIVSSERRRPGFVKFTETRHEQFHRGRRETGLEKAAARRKAVPDAVSTRLKRPGGETNYLPRTQQILSSDPD
ncbi:hypothetical protein SLS53_006207 [Cytospora paraplurivora]|uniref:Uncharacterized protein n=1 Tax=Cytospora paraplurivora TaxID=2898453 RepID=A0AAN9UBY4_9PEZI